MQIYILSSVMCMTETDGPKSWVMIGHIEGGALSSIGQSWTGRVGHGLDPSIDRIGSYNCDPVFFSFIKFLY